MIWNTKMVDSRFYSVVTKTGGVLSDVAEADTDEGSLLRIVQDDVTNFAAKKALGLGIVYHKSFGTYFEIVDRRNGEVLDLYDPKNPVIELVHDDDIVKDGLEPYQNGNSKKITETFNRMCSCKNGCKSPDCDKI